MLARLFHAVVSRKTTLRPAQRRQRSPLSLEALEERTVLSGGNLVVFGDSLSDVGNVSLATGGSLPPQPPYVQGRFSNGPNWVDTLAHDLGKPALVPSLLPGGLDYAFGGATVAVAPSGTFSGVPTVSQQIGQYLAGHTPAAGDVFAVWAGANDFFDSFSTMSVSGLLQLAVQSADTLVGNGPLALPNTDSLQTLVSSGARLLVVNNLPPLGETPYISELSQLVPGLNTLADAWVQTFNGELKADLTALKQTHPGVTIVSNDTASLFQQILGSPSSYGFTDTTDPAGAYLDFPNTVLIAPPAVANAANYLFFDGVHPTTKAAQMVGLQAAADFDAALGINHLVVSSTADTVDPLATGLSLREAINLADMLPGSTAITFNLGSGPHQITLSGQDLPITANVNISGPSNGSLSISGAGASRIFEISSGASASLSNLTLSNGLADNGGAIRNAGRLQLYGVTLSHNTAQKGGAIYNTGALLASFTQFLANTATGASISAGGALANSGSSSVASISFSSFAGNQAQGSTTGEGGALANLAGGQLTLAFSTVVGNSASGVNAFGGGIFNDGSSTLNVLASLVTGNAIRWNANLGGQGVGWNLYTAPGGKVVISFSLIGGSLTSVGGLW